MKLNEKIFYCRRKAGLSQEALAEELGVSRQAVSKWETGDAVPEIGKLVSLAKTFDVTTDWLLSEEEPEEKSNGANYYQETASWGSTTAGEGTSAYYSSSRDTTTSAERFEKAADEWMDRVPGILGKMVRRFGWLAGVYIAVGGAGSTLMGLLAKIMVGAFNKTADSMLSGFNNAAGGMMGGFGGGSVMFYDESGNALSAGESAELAEILGMGSTGGVGSMMDSMSSMLQNNPVEIIGNILLIGGLIALVGGSVLAVLWYKKAKETQK